MPTAARLPSLDTLLGVIGEGRTKRLAEGRTRREAMRALKRQLSNVIYRHLIADVTAARLDLAA